MVNIIADIAGQYKGFLKLLEKMPDDDVVSVGDMVDRGPDSKEVVEWFMKNGKAVLGNHEHMMVDFLRRGNFYDRGTWLWNGGGATQNSYGTEGVPEEVLVWLESLPFYMEFDGVLVSHSFLRPSAVDDDVVLKECCSFGTDISKKGESTIIWNRLEPIRRERWNLQIVGHNSQFGLRRWADERGEYAICLDDCRNKKLTGIHLPSLEIFQQDYIE